MYNPVWGGGDLCSPPGSLQPGAFALGNSAGCGDPAGLESVDTSKLVGEWKLVRISEVSPRTKCAIMRPSVDASTSALKPQSRYCDSGSPLMRNATLIYAQARFRARCEDSTKFDQISYAKLILSGDTYVWWYACIPKSYCEPEPTDMVMIFWKSGVPVVDQKTIEKAIKDAKKVPNPQIFCNTEDECCQK